jgi:hypothetical protein
MDQKERRAHPEKNQKNVVPQNNLAELYSTFSIIFFNMF